MTAPGYLPDGQSELRVALLGQGFMGKAHSNAWTQVGHFFDVPYRIRRKLIAGRNAAALEQMARRWEWEETTTDWRSAIDRPDIDAIDIALPNYLHAPVALAAAQAGKIVLCEKPLAISLAEAETMAQAVQNLPTLVWFNYRRVPAVGFAQQLIADGRLGTIYHYRATYLNQSGVDPSRAATWRMDPQQAGSGATGDLLSHLVDTALWLNGGITEVDSMNRIFFPSRAVDDAVIALAAFQNGSIGSFEATRFAVGCRNQNRFEIHGSRGMLRFDLERLNHLEFFDATAPPAEQGLRDVLVTGPGHPWASQFWRPGHIIGYEHTFIAALADFLFALARGERFHPDFQDALRVQRVLHAVECSARARQWTAVEDACAI
jgi:predicted dehydrogenase